MDTLTVGELIKKLQREPKDAKVYMLTDRSDNNWDEDRCSYKKVHGIEYVERETIYSDNCFDDDEINVLLEIEC